MSRLVDPYWPFMQLRREISQLLEDAGGQWAVPAGFPAVNIWEDENNFYAEAPIPGVAAENLEVFTIGDELTIRGKREPTVGRGQTELRRERGSGEFERVIELPAHVQAEHVEAKLHNGVLTLTMPKAEVDKPRRIAVKAEA